MVYKLLVFLYFESIHIVMGWLFVSCYDMSNIFLVYCLRQHDTSVPLYVYIKRFETQDIHIQAYLY